METIVILETNRADLYDKLAEEIKRLNEDFCIVNVCSFFDNLNEKHTAIINFK
jgi:hypothetical protein